MHKTNKSAFRLNSSFLVTKAIRIYYFNVCFFISLASLMLFKGPFNFYWKTSKGFVCITVQNAVQLGELENSYYKRASAVLDSINKVKLIGRRGVKKNFFARTMSKLVIGCTKRIIQRRARGWKTVDIQLLKVHDLFNTEKEYSNIFSKPININ